MSAGRVMTASDREIVGRVFRDQAGFVRLMVRVGLHRQGAAWLGVDDIESAVWVAACERPGMLVAARDERNVLSAMVGRVIHDQLRAAAGYLWRGRIRRSARNGGGFYPGVREYYRRGWRSKFGVLESDWSASSGDVIDGRLSVFDSSYVIGLL